MSNEIHYAVAVDGQRHCIYVDEVGEVMPRFRSEPGKLWPIHTSETQAEAHSWLTRFVADARRAGRDVFYDKFNDVYYYGRYYWER